MINEPVKGSRGVRIGSPPNKVANALSMGKMQVQIVIPKQHEVGILSDAPRELKEVIPPAIATVRCMHTYKQDPKRGTCKAYCKNPGIPVHCKTIIRLEIKGHECVFPCKPQLNTIGAIIALGAGEADMRARHVGLTRPRPGFL